MRHFHGDDGRRNGRVVRHRAPCGTAPCSELSGRRARGLSLRPGVITDGRTEGKAVVWWTRSECRLRATRQSVVRLSVCLSRPLDVVDQTSHAYTLSYIPAASA